MSRPSRWALNAASAVLGFAVCAGILTATGALTADRLPPCPTEDSVQCYWDASTMGNGSGTDVVNP